MVWLVGAAGHHVTTQGPCTWTLMGTPSPPQPCLVVLRLGWVILEFVSLILTSIFNLLLPLRL